MQVVWLQWWGMNSLYKKLQKISNQEGFTLFGQILTSYSDKKSVTKNKIRKD